MVARPAKRPVCPICHTSLERGDLLLAEWYQPRRWWVLKHVKDGDEWCVDADHPFVHEFAKPTEELA